MKNAAKILAFKGKELKTVDDVRAALLAILLDIRSGDVTVAESQPIQKEINTRMKEVRGQLKGGTSKDKHAVKSFFGK